MAVCQSQKVKVETISVSTGLILLKTLKESLVVVKNEVLKHSSLCFVQKSFLGHLAHHSEKHARLWPHLGCKHALCS